MKTIKAIFGYLYNQKRKMKNLILLALVIFGLVLCSLHRDNQWKIL